MSSAISRTPVVALSLLTFIAFAAAQAPSFQARPVADPIPAFPAGARPQSANSGTVTTLDLSASTVNAGTAVILTVHVTAGKTLVSPGIVLICADGLPACAGPALLATAVLNPQGSATRTLMLPAGSYSLVASFSGTAPYASSSSAPQSLTVQGNSTYAVKAALTNVTGSKGVYALGASLSSHGPLAPTGSLVFTDSTNNLKLGAVPLADPPLGGYQPFGLISTGLRSGPNDLVLGDFNADGIPDVAVPGSATGVVAVFLGKGDGTFAPAVNFSTGAGSQPLAVAVGDFNADGKLDLAVALGNKPAVAILLGNGDGSFQPARIYPSAASALNYPLALTVGDFNRDGRLDLVTANNAVGASVLLGNGDGSFQSYRLLPSSKGPAWIAAGDWNNDGILDLAIPTAANTVDLSLGNGDGSFKPFTTLPTGNGTAPESVAAADLDGDGNLDLVVACYGANAVGVLLGNGDGTFLPIELYAAGAGPLSVAIGDLNLDGIPDLLVTNLTGSSLSLFAGNGDGTFLPLPGYSTTAKSEPAASAIADLNADGTPEIVTVLYGANALYILENDRVQGAMLKGVSLSTAGTVNLTASYAGDALYATGNSAAYPFTGSATTSVAPAFAPAAGTFATPQTVTLASTTPGAKIFYTLDGSTPTSKSLAYAGAIPVNSSMTISAMATASGYTNSSVAKAAYVITGATLALTANPAAPRAGQAVQLSAVLSATASSSLAGAWTISESSTQLCSAVQSTQSSLVCSVKLAHGNHALKAAYTGKTNGWSLSATLSLTVN